MDNYKIIHKIALGEPGSTVSAKDFEEAGVNIDALLASGHIECAQAPKPKPKRASRFWACPLTRSSYPSILVPTSHEELLRMLG